MMVSIISLVANSPHQCNVLLYPVKYISLTTGSKMPASSLQPATHLNLLLAITASSPQPPPSTYGISVLDTLELRQSESFLVYARKVLEVSYRTLPRIRIQTTQG